MSEAYYAFLEETELAIPEMENRLQSMINVDPDFLDSYLYLAELYYQTDDPHSYSRLIYDAYIRAPYMIADKDGHYPEQLSWRWLENRHIIRSLSNFALLQWDQGDIRLALEIYRKLLASNLHDAIGARYAILALRMGYGPDYERLFLPDIEPVYGLDGIKLDKWFTKHSKQFPEEFRSLKTYAKGLVD